MRLPFRWIVLSLVVLATDASAQAPIPAKPKAGVKELTETTSGRVQYTGVVEVIDADRMVVVEITDRGQVKEHIFAPIDLLRKGQYIRKEVSWGWYTYRWQDVKAGDTVTLEAMWDPDEKVNYCMQVCIDLRPKDKLPKSQELEKDDYYAVRSVYNDIENGLDVSDEELKKVFPPEFKVDRKTGEKTPVKPGVVYLSYMKKLDAIRAKKKDELKAPPPNKDDKK